MRRAGYGKIASAGPPMSGSVPGERIALDFAVSYTGALSPVEKEPKMWVYLGLPVEAAPKVMVSHIVLPENDPDKKVQVHLEYEYDPRHPLPIDTKVCFYATCKRPNDTGAPGPVSAGYGCVNLIDLVANVNGELYNQLVPLKHQSCEGRVKGVVHVQALKRNIHISNKIAWENLPINASLHASATIGGVERTLNPAEVLMVEYIKSVMMLEMSFPNTFPDTANVRIPIYFGDVGMLNVQAPLPAAAYFIYRTPDSNPRFWKNAAENIARNDGHTVYDLDRMDLTHKARFMANMVCAVVQRMDYQPDVNDLNEKPHKGVPGLLKECVSCKQEFDPDKVLGAERFGDALRDKCGDCEDLDEAISMSFDSFLAAYHRGDFKDHKQLQELGRIGDQYIYFNSLDSVTAAAVKAEGQVVKKLGAHMKGQFLPAIYVKECIERGATDVGKLASDGKFKVKAGIIADLIGASVETAKGIPFKPFSKDARELPVLIAEGTGMLEPYGIENDPISKERAFVNRHLPSTAAGRKLIVRKPGEGSAFFVGSMLFFTSYWFNLGANVCGAWLGYSGAVAQANAKIGADIGMGKGPAAEDLVNHFQRGVTFEEICGKSERISIVPHPEIPEQCMQVMRRAVRARIPPRDLVLTEEGMRKHPEKNAKLDALCAFANGMRREVQVKQEPVPIFFQPHQLVDQVVRGLENDIRNATQVARVNYTLEHWTDWMYDYKVTVLANVM